MLITQYTALLLQSVKKPLGPENQEDDDSPLSSSTASLEDALEVDALLDHPLEEPRRWLHNAGYIGPGPSHGYRKMIVFLSNGLFWRSCPVLSQAAESAVASSYCGHILVLLLLDLQSLLSEEKRELKYLSTLEETLSCFPLLEHKSVKSRPVYSLYPPPPVPSIPSVCNTISAFDLHQLREKPDHGPPPTPPRCGSELVALQTNSALHCHDAML
ncbi:hypothetical protein FOCC_FOCC002008 [Frankliniella occidentalis]|nr:hypothetical protein FOCC_FOCC002008 [Frankliniella occidentalis]